MRKLKQTSQQQKQAIDAISLYYGNKTINNGNNSSFKTKNETISSKKGKLMRLHIDDIERKGPRIQGFEGIILYSKVISLAPLLAKLA